MGIGRQVARGVCWAACAAIVGVPFLQPALASASTDALVVRGDVADLVPGQAGSLVLTVENPGSAEAVVTTLRVRVRSAEGACPTTALSVPEWRGRLVVPAGGEVSQPVQLRLAADCSDARFALDYEASGA